MLLRYSLLQIGKLLGICFGFHGSEVVGLNISHSETGGDFTNELHGDGINNGIFGFCRIKNFDRIITALGEEALVYANSIAEILHMEIFKHNGIPNKNLGDTFLLLWIIPDFDSTFTGDPDSIIVND